MSAERVLVTGGSGFLAAHCILRLLDAGYRVRTTVRSLNRETDVRAMLKAGGAEPGEAVTFVAADLLSDEHWSEAVKGCTYVLHVASPFPPTTPKDENELIIPARDGALRVLRSAREAQVKRVVLTSSFAAIGYGHKPSQTPFTEETWTDLAAPLSAYVKSKTIAERAAWDFILREGGSLELAVVNPVGILGPALGPDLSTSIRMVEQLLKGALPRIPRVSFGVVDVRDVADLHLRAMTNSAAKGERFLATSGVMSLLEGARWLRANMDGVAGKVTTKPFPDWVLRMAALVNPMARQVVGDLGAVRGAANEKARRVLGWQPRTVEEALRATVESLVRLKLLGT